MTERFTPEIIAENDRVLAKRFGSKQAGVDAIVAGWPTRLSDQDKCDQAAYLVETGLWTELEARHGLEAAGIDLA